MLSKRIRRYFSIFVIIIFKELFFQAKTITGPNALKTICCGLSGVVKSERSREECCGSGALGQVYDGRINSCCFGRGYAMIYAQVM